MILMEVKVLSMAVGFGSSCIGGLTVSALVLFVGQYGFTIRRSPLRIFLGRTLFFEKRKTHFMA